jgi:hypothetical protein
MVSRRGRTRIISPYDTDARHNGRRETCDNGPDEDGTPDAARPPNLITNVVTTDSAVAD